VLLDSVKDLLIPHISEKKTTKDMYDALVGLYQSSNANRKLIFKHKLHSVEMSKLDTTACYLMRITQIRDELEGFPKFDEIVIFLRGLVLYSEFLNLKILLNKNLCLLCMGCFLPNLCTFAIMFCHNFSVKLFNNSSSSLLFEVTWK